MTRPTLTSPRGSLILGLGAFACLVGLGCGEGAPEGAAPAPLPRGAAWESEQQTLQAMVNRLGTEAPHRSPGTELSLAVKDLTTGASASFQGEVPRVAASAVKAVWVAAALRTLGVAPVVTRAEAIFRRSDPAATASLLALTGTHNLERFYEDAGLTRSTLGLKGVEDAGAAPVVTESVDENTTLTALDAIQFLASVDAGLLLSAQETAALRGWMRLSPRTGFGGWLGTRLPHEARAGLLHKAGWQPQGPLHILNDVGIVQVPHGHRYAIAILASRGTDYWGAQIPFVESVSAQVYQAVAELSGNPRVMAEP